MKYSDQVAAAIRSLHPEARKQIRRALSNLDSGKKCDVKALKSPLEGFWRLRVGKYRVIFHRNPELNELIAEFLDSRDTVYESFHQKPKTLP